MQGKSDYAWEIIDDEAGLDRIAPEWSALNAKCGPEGFFTRLEVIRANWARHRGDPGKSLHIAVFRQAGDLMLCAPMVKVREPVGTHKFLWLDSKTPLYDDVLLDPDVEVETAARQFMRFLSSSLLTRLLKIGFVREGSALFKMLQAAGLPLHFRTGAPSVRISQYRDWEYYLSSISANRRQQYRNFCRRIEKAGALPVRFVTDPSERRSQMAALFAEKRLWVEARDDLLDWIVPAETEAWFQYLSDQDDGTNRCHLIQMNSETEWISSMLFFERGDRLFLSKFVHNKSWDRFSPGWLIVNEVVKYGIERGFDEVDFMIGRGVWKDRIADKTSGIYSCRAGLLPWQRGRYS
ncbi:GNAT family N-acetyltransferase [Hoeflea poritis]|nr:GNAT family N-acetyltransferase [Hoeflea poritis]